MPLYGFFNSPLLKIDHGTTLWLWNHIITLNVGAFELIHTILLLEISISVGVLICSLTRFLNIFTFVCVVFSKNHSDLIFQKELIGLRLAGQKILKDGPEHF